MLEWIISSSVLIVVVAVLRQLLRGKLSLRFQYALWGLVLVRLLIPVSVGETGFSVMNAVPRQTEELYVWYTGDMGAALPAEPDAGGKPGTPSEIVPSPGVSVGPYTGPVPANTTGIRLDRVWSGVWMAGMAVAALCLLSANLHFGRELKKTRRALEVEDCPLPVYLSRQIETPCLFGLFRPAVYITPEVAEDPKTLGHVLAHEATHYRHGDHIWALTRCLCLVLHWYNPLVWLAARLSRRDGELACDEGTLRRIGEEARADYGRTLIGLTCANRGVGAFLTTATTMTGGKKSIKERIMLIAKKPKIAVHTLIAVLLIVSLAVSCTFTGAKDSEPGDEFYDSQDSVEETDGSGEAVPLTAEQIDEVNAAFAQILFDSDDTGRVHPITGNEAGRVNPLCGFFASYYDRPEELNLAEFLRYFPGGEAVTNEAEFNALKELEKWPFAAHTTLDSMPVPIHKYSAGLVDTALRDYTGVPLESLTGAGHSGGGLLYLPEYDAYYNFTSDFGPGLFHCTGGEIDGDTVRLYGTNDGGGSAVLALRHQDGRYLITAHQKLDG